MFFDLVLLQQQHRARFGLAWIAATRGVRYLNKNDVIALDVGKLCEDIAQFVCSQSDSPRSRFSLRLSSVLINGTMKIYKQKAIFFLDDMVKFMTVISMPMSLHISKSIEATIFLTPPSPVTATKTKRRRRVFEKETPQSELDKIAQAITVQQVAEEIELAEKAMETSILQARVDDITLREIRPSTQDRGGIGDLGILSEEDLAQLQDLGVQPLAPMIRKSITGMESTPLLPTVQELPEVMEPPPSTTTAPSPSPIEPVGGVKITVEALVHAPATGEAVEELPLKRAKKRTLHHVQQPLEIIESVTEHPVVPPEEPMEIDVRETPARTALQEMQTDVAAERDKTVKVQKVVKKKTADLTLLLISNKPPKVVRIDRCKFGDLQLAPVSPCPMPQFRLSNPNFTNLLNLYLVGEVRDVHRGRSDASSLQDSLRRKSRLVVTPPAKISDEERAAARIVPQTIEEHIEQQLAIPQALPLPNETQLPLMESTPLTTRQIQVERVQTEERTREETIAAAAEAALIESPRKRRRLLDVQPELPMDSDFLMVPGIPSRELTASAVILPQESAVDSVSVPIPGLNEKVRQQDIVNALLQTEREYLTLEDVCMRPVNKLNIARAFSDLLVLCKYRYVELVSEENSCVLKYIGKGHKMVR